MESRRSTRRKAREEQGTARPVSRTTTRRTRAKVVVAEPAAEEPENLRGSASNKAKSEAPATRTSRRGRAAKKAPVEEQEDETENVLLEDSQVSDGPENDESESDAAPEEELEASEEDEVEDEDAVMVEPEVATKDEVMEEAAPATTEKKKQPIAKENVPPSPLSIPAAGLGAALASDDRVATSAHGKRGAVPRLMIKCIQLTNFKSYAGTRTIGPFHHRFSAVVGPNGSGKSNLIDALLFVFGYRTKKLRLNKVSELIHNSNHGRGLPSAKVEVFFQQVIDIEGPGELYDVLEDSEFSISRVATSDNKSMYYVNDQKKTFSDVQKELTKHHIDLNNNRFLILQGEVELISQMKPKAPSAHGDGLLEYIEDIIGTNALIPAIEEAAEKVHQTNVARSVQLNRVRAAEKAMSSLVEAKEEAEEHRSIQCQIIDHNACLYQLQAVSHQAQIDQLQADKEDITKTLEEVEKRQDAYNGELESLDKEFSSTTKQHTTVHKDMLECKEQFDACEKKRTKLKTDIKHHQSKGKSYLKTEEKESKKERELQRSLETAKSDLVSAEEAIETLTEELKKEEEKLVEVQGSLKEKTSSLRQEMEVAKTELIPKKKKIGDLQAEIDVAQSELSMLEEEANASQQKLDETTAAIAAAKERAAEAGKLIKEKKEEVATAKKRLPDVEDEIRRTADQEQELTAKKSEIESTLDESAAQATASRSQSKVLQACMMLKAERNLSVYGRLGDLGSIDDKYDVAITTACGSQLDQVVVEKTADAQQCANYLKQHQVGRCTFLILEKIQGLKSRMMQAKGKTPAPRLFDLIKPKADIFLPAFYSVVRDTLLASEFSSAKKIAFGKPRYRVVTMTGQVIESSGLLSGGGTRQLRGGMRGSANSGPVMSKAEMTKLQRELQTITKDLHTSREALNSLREEKSECEDLIETSHLELTKLDMDVKGMKNQEKELEAQLPELEKRAAAKANAGDLKQIETLKSHITKGQKPLKKAKADAEDIEATIKSLQDRIMDVGGMPLKIQQAKVDGIESQISDTHRVITRLQVKLKTMEKNVAKITKAISEAQAGAKEEEEHLLAKKTELEELVATAKEVKKKYEEAQSILDDTSEELAGYTKKVEKAKSKLTKLRAAKTDLEIQLSDLAEKIKGSDGSRQGCYDRLKALEEEKASLYDEYEQASAETKVRRLQADEIQSINAKKIHGQVNLLKEKLEAMSPNMGAIAEYRAQETEFHKREAELATVTEQRDELQRLCEELRKRRLDEFMAGFAIINTKLKEMYRLITLEGDAELEFVDTIDPFSEGIVFSVRPPKKSWKNIANLSGGEKTLSSLALVFALHHYKPTPLYFMDEIDAALDFKNVSIVAHYVKERTKNAQFIIISLRNNMFELADRLVGIYKPQNCTYSVAITPKEFSIGSQRSGAAVPA